MYLDFEVVGLNFSSATTPELMLKTFDHYCEYRKTPNGIVLSPIQLNSWIIIFCDEINLPDEDKYGTQRVISFIRQILEHGGFYRTSDQQWVKLERLQFVGACNPPTVKILFTCLLRKFFFDYFRILDENLFHIDFVSFSNE